MSAATSALVGLLDRYATPGEPAVAVGVLRDGEVVDSAVVGLASIEHDVAATSGTRFDIASCSKQFTCACVLLLERDGALSLDDDVRDYLPGMHLRERVTLRQLASHTGGIREYMSLNVLVGAGESSWQTEEQVVRQLRAYEETDFPPGSEWSYSNTGYIALAAVIRAVSGSSMREFASERLLQPLGMQDSGFQDDASRISPRQANGYERQGEGFVRADSSDEIVGDGGLITHLGDLAHWSAFLADGRVLGTDIRDRLVTRAVLTSGREIGYALGVEHVSVSGRAAVAHGGAIRGYRAHLLHVLEEGFGIAVLANRSDAHTAGVAQAAAVRVLEASARRATTSSTDRAASDVTASPPRAGAIPTGLWFAARQEVFACTREDTEGRTVLEAGGTAMTLDEESPGVWRPVDVGADLTVRITELGLDLQLAGHDWNAVHYERMDAEDAGDPASVCGVYESAELGALAIVSVTGSMVTMQVGAAPPLPLLPVAPGLWRTPFYTVRLALSDSGVATALLVSGSRVRGLRLTRTEDGAVARGFPICLGGPHRGPGSQ